MACLTNVPHHRAAILSGRNLPQRQIDVALAQAGKRTHITGMLRKIPFIKPMAPSLVKVPPAGPDWLHEVKFDG
jgi:ATP-dependent DNA ligase